MQPVKKGIQPGQYLEMLDTTGKRFVGRAESDGVYVDVGLDPQKIEDPSPVVIDGYWSYRQRMRLERPGDFCEFEFFLREVCEKHHLDDLAVTTLAHWAFHGGDFFGSHGIEQGLAALAECQAQAMIRNTHHAIAA